MSSSDDKIIQSVDTIISAVGQLVNEIKAANDLDQHKKEIALEKVSSVARQMDEINHAIFVDPASLNDATLAENSAIETSFDEQDAIPPRVVPLPLPVIGGGEHNDMKTQDDVELADEARETPWSEGDEVAETLFAEGELTGAGVSEDESHVEIAEVEFINEVNGHIEEGEHSGEVKQPRLVLTPVVQPVGDEETVSQENEAQFNAVSESETDAAVGSDEDGTLEIDLHEDERSARGQEHNLQLIKGIDNEVAALLDRNGISSFQDISAFQEADTIWISEALGEPGRVARENWIEQAALLAVDTPTSYSLNQVNTEYFDRLSLLDAYSDDTGEQRGVPSYDAAGIDDKDSVEEVPQLNQDVFKALASDYLGTVGEPPAFLQQDEVGEDDQSDVVTIRSADAGFSEQDDNASVPDAETSGLTSIGFVPNLIKKLVSEEDAEESRSLEPGTFEDAVAQDDFTQDDVIQGGAVKVDVTGVDVADVHRVHVNEADDMTPPVFDHNSAMHEDEDAEDADSTFISQTLMDKKRELEAELASLTAQMQHQTTEQEAPFSEAPEVKHPEWADESFAQRTEKPPVVEILDHHDGDGALTVPHTTGERGDDGLPPGTGAIWHEEVSTAAGYVPPIVNDEEDFDTSETDHTSSFESGVFETDVSDDGFRDAAYEAEKELNSEIAPHETDDIVHEARHDVEGEAVFDSSDIALPIGQKRGVTGTELNSETEFSETELASLDAGREEDYWSAVAGGDGESEDFSEYEAELNASDDYNDRMMDPDIDVPAQRGFLAVPLAQPELSAGMMSGHDEMKNDHEVRYEDDEAKVSVSSEHLDSQPLGMYLARKLPLNGSVDEHDETEAEFSQENSQDEAHTQNETPVLPPELPGSGAPFAGPPVLPPVPAGTGARLSAGPDQSVMPPPQPPVQPATAGFERDGRLDQHSLNPQGERHGDGLRDGLPGNAHGGPRRLPVARDGMPPAPGGRPSGVPLPRGGVAGHPPLPPMIASEHLSGPPLGPPVVPQLAQDGPAGREGPAGRHGAYRGNGRDNGLRTVPNRDVGRNGFPQRRPQRHLQGEGQPPVRHEHVQAEGLNNENGEIPAWSEFSEHSQDRAPQKSKGVSEGFRERAKKFAENLQKSLVEKE